MPGCPKVWEFVGPRTIQYTQSITCPKEPYAFDCHGMTCPGTVGALQFEVDAPLSLAYMESRAAKDGQFRAVYKAEFPHGTRTQEARNVNPLRTALDGCPAPTTWIIWVQAGCMVLLVWSLAAPTRRP
jgi:hypothetical protein